MVHMCPVASMCYRQASLTPQALPAHIITTLVHQSILLLSLFKTPPLLRELAQVEVDQ